MQRFPHATGIDGRQTRYHQNSEDSFKQERTLLPLVLFLKRAGCSIPVLLRFAAANFAKLETGVDYCSHPVRFASRGKSFRYQIIEGVASPLIECTSQTEMK